MRKPINQGNEPLVSIITPLYNAQNFIAKTIQSVQSQSYPNWEHIIVDDCSTDSSVEIARAFAVREPRVKLSTLSQNSGAAHARNKAISEAKGNYIAFLDADDLWHPEKLKLQIAFMQQHDCVVSYTNYVHIDNQGDELGKRIIALPQLSYAKQHSNNYVGNLTGIYNVNELDKVMAPDFKKRQDWAVWLEAIKRSGKPALGIQKDLAYYRILDTSISANKLNLVKYNYHFYKTYLKYGTIKASLWMLRFFWEYFIVRKRWIQTYKPKTAN